MTLNIKKITCHGVHITSCAFFKIYHRSFHHGCLFRKIKFGSLDISTSTVGMKVQGQNRVRKCHLREVTTSNYDPEYFEDVDIEKLFENKKFKKTQEQGVTARYASDVKPEETSCILFPGQGTQFVGMGKKLLQYPNVKDMYDRASAILEYDILKLSCEGPESDLNQTKYQQPAIFLASLAAIEKLRHEQPSDLESCVATAGFSIGEITALTFAGAFSFENAVRLVKVRGEAMQIASDLNRSGMITVFFGADSKLKFACTVAKEFCQRSGMEEVDCRVANYLYPHCKVIAGNEEALQFIIKNKDDFKLRKLRRLNVSGAFHTDLMKPAAFVFSEALKNTHVSNPAIPVFSNVNGLPYKDKLHIRHQLPKQIYRPVYWEQTLHSIYERKANMKFPKTFECGPGRSLKAILKNVNIKAWSCTYSVDV